MASCLSNVDINYKITPEEILEEEEIYSPHENFLDFLHVKIPQVEVDFEEEESQTRTPSGRKTPLRRRWSFVPPLLPLPILDGETPPTPTDETGVEEKISEDTPTHMKTYAYRRLGNSIGRHGSKRSCRLHDRSWSWGTDIRYLFDEAMGHM